MEDFRNPERSNRFRSELPSARSLLRALPERCCRASRDAAALEALLPCPGRREIYLREIVCEYVRTLISVTPLETLTAHLEEVPLSVSAYSSVPAA
jgi:hypothetical protein